MGRRLYASQGRRLIALLKRKPMTYYGMLSLGISTSPWRRVKECLGPYEVLMKGQTKDGLTTWSVRESAR